MGRAEERPDPARVSSGKGNRRDLRAGNAAPDTAGEKHEGSSKRQTPRGVRDSFSYPSSSGKQQQPSTLCNSIKTHVSWTSFSTCVFFTSGKTMLQCSSANQQLKLPFLKSSFYSNTSITELLQSGQNIWKLNNCVPIVLDEVGRECIGTKPFLNKIQTLHRALLCITHFNFRFPADNLIQ